MYNKRAHYVKEFILHTRRNIFLTGRAGTGKTTLLHQIIKETKKNTIVVAPTGVAAIQAGGTTIHSMFQLPISTFIPTNDAVDPQYFTNRRELAIKQKMRKNRRNLLMELDLLIIDEISMVRADLLDAVDITLRRVRKNSEAFGGVQVLVIGDLFQLAPVVKPHTWQILSQYYETPFFFSSRAWKSAKYLKIELKKIYRQEDPIFIDILNHIRNGTATDDDLRRLNEQNNQQFESKDTITLTTHNRKAQAINARELQKLDTTRYLLEAKIEGQFNETAYPVQDVLEFKKGCQVMFIRNDPEGMYFNGKIGTITHKIDETLFVRCEDDLEICVEPVEWKNISYKLNAQTNKIDQKELGSFVQYPLKLAWAVTVHKSQGLTFDRVILDLEDSFAPGQLYVALSRCRSLQGMSLSSQINAQNVIIDQRIKKYYDQDIDDELLDEELKRAIDEFDDYKCKSRFDLTKVSNRIEGWRESIALRKITEKGKTYRRIKAVQNQLDKLQKIKISFDKQLDALMVQAHTEEGIRIVIERCHKAIEYFTDQVHDEVLLPIQAHRDKYAQHPKTGSYIKELDQVLHILWLWIEALYRLEYRDQVVFGDQPKHKRKIKNTPASPKSRPSKGATYATTLDLWQQGKTIDEIAKERNLTVGTIRSHLGKWLAQGKIQITELIPPNRLEKIKNHLSGYAPDTSLSILVNESNFGLEYYEIRWYRYASATTPS